MINKKILYTSLLAIFATAIIGCDSDDDDPVFKDMTLSVEGLPQLGSFATYEGWLLDGNDYTSIGKFTIDNSGDVDGGTFSIDEELLQNATDFVVTIEPSPDPAVQPTETQILSGTFIGNSATLNYENEAAIGTGFSTAIGKYILSTPTNGEETDELSGVWWLEPTGPSASLILPDLSEGWIYEGWALINGTPVSTGKFTKANEADMGNPYSGTLAGPDFPGEDFLRNAPAGLSFPTSLEGATIVISVEPNPDNDSAPFVIKPLSGEVPEQAAPGVLYNMTNNDNSINISGEATR